MRYNPLTGCAVKESNLQPTTSYSRLTPVQWAAVLCETWREEVIRPRKPAEPSKRSDNKTTTDSASGLPVSGGET